MKKLKHSGLVVMVPRLIVKLVAAVTAVTTGITVLTVVLQVTLRRVPVVASVRCVTKISLLAVTALVLTTQVPVEAAVAQENDPAGAEVQEATEGFAAVPTAAQFVFVRKFPVTISGPVVVN